MPYLAVGIRILALTLCTAMRVGYLAFAAAMSVVNAVSSEPVVHLHDRIIAEATAAATTL